MKYILAAVFGFYLGTEHQVAIDKSIIKYELEVCKTERDLRSDQCSWLVEAYTK